VVDINHGGGTHRFHHYFAPAFLLGTSSQITAARSIGLTLGELNEPLWKAPSGILFRLSKKTANYIFIVISYVPDKWLSVF